MKSILETNYTIDESKKQIIVEREFKATLNLVWRAWTEKDILDKWWAPKPYVTITKYRNFEPKGIWFYAMKSPEDQYHWCRQVFGNIDFEKEFEAQDNFCLENEEVIESMPSTQWNVNFSTLENTTLVKITLTFESLEKLKTIIEMGFKQGFAMAHENLDEYFSEL